jgi:hypothetical protein
MTAHLRCSQISPCPLNMEPRMAPRRSADSYPAASKASRRSLLLTRRQERAVFVAMHRRSAAFMGERHSRSPWRASASRPRRSRSRGAGKTLASRCKAVTGRGLFGLSRLNRLSFGAGSQPPLPPVLDGRPNARVPQPAPYGPTRCATKVIGPVSQRPAPPLRLTRTLALKAFLAVNRPVKLSLPGGDV